MTYVFTYNLKTFLIVEIFLAIILFPNKKKEELPKLKKKK